MNTSAHKDLPAWWSLGLPLAMLALTFYAYLASPELLHALIRKDTDPAGGGIAEHGTVLILLPGIAAGFVILARYRERLPLWMTGWILAWTLACIYFAGEEASWGQHYFNWGTPEQLRTLNDQQETNLHNIGTWFDQKPRTLVELWVIVAGLFLPVWKHIRRSATTSRGGWRAWFWPTAAGVPAAAIFLGSLIVANIGKGSGRADLHALGSNELREFYIAFFLAGYLLSIWIRMRRQT